MAYAYSAQSVTVMYGGNVGVSIATATASVSSGQVSGYTLCDLPASSSLYCAVKNHFHSSIDDQYEAGSGSDAKGIKYGALEVIAIYQLENPQLFQTYSRYKDYIVQLWNADKSLFGKGKIKAENHKLSQRCDEDLNEYYLFHGASGAAIDGILEEGFKKSYNENSFLGQATYLADSPSKADQYSDKNQRVRNGTHLHMLVTKALLGRAYRCKKTVKFHQPPCTCGKDNCDDHVHFNSVIGTRRSNGKRLLFDEYVLYDDRACFPEFVVKYKRV